MWYIFCLTLLMAAIFGAFSKYEWRHEK